MHTVRELVDEKESRKLLANLEASKVLELATLDDDTLDEIADGTRDGLTVDRDAEAGRAAGAVVANRHVHPATRGEGSRRSDRGRVAGPEVNQ